MYNRFIHVYYLLKMSVSVCGKLTTCGLAKSCSSFIGSFVVLYADAILLQAQTVSQLQKLLTNCERVINQLDMAINSKKRCCLRIGQRHNNPCAPLCTLSGS